MMNLEQPKIDIYKIADETRDTLWILTEKSDVARFSYVARVQEELYIRAVVLGRTQEFFALGLEAAQTLKANTATGNKIHELADALETELTIEKFRRDGASGAVRNELDLSRLKPVTELAQ